MKKKKVGGGEGKEGEDAINHLIDEALFNRRARASGGLKGWVGKHYGMTYHDLINEGQEGFPGYGCELGPQKETAR